MNVVLRPEAKADLVDAYDWYEEQQAQLGDRFLTFVEDAISEYS
jgi:plasmid stabilization system protein ParE